MSKQYKSNLPELQLKYKNGDVKKVKINNSKDIYKLLLEIYESSIAVYLNRANNTIGWFKISQGGMDSTVMDTRLILATALKCGATAIILSHNHPSGTLIASQSDIKITKKIKNSCNIMDITLLDHIIITKDSYKSFADEGIL